MSIYYSPSNNAFVSPLVSALPSDAIEISDELHVSLLAEQGQGKLIKPGPDGMPVADVVVVTVDLKAYAAFVRYAKEIGGMEVGGVHVATDETSQAKLTGAYLKASRDATFTTDWKGTDGTFTSLDADSIIALGDAVLAHVAACFAAEKMVAAEIDTGSITTVTQVDAAFAALL